MERTEPTRGAGPSYRGLVVVAAAIVLLLVAAVVVVLVAGDRDDPALEPGSPEAAIAAYLAAFEAGDLEAAHAHFSSAVRARWDLEAYRRSVDAYGFEAGRGDRTAWRVIFTGAETDGDVATVRLTIEEFSGKGLEGESYRWDSRVRMAREAGRWTIDEPLVRLDPVPTTIP